MNSFTAKSYLRCFSSSRSWPQSSFDS